MCGREPMAYCLSNLNRLFARGQEFTYSSGDISRYYRTYLELMRHWDKVLPGRYCEFVRGRRGRSRGNVQRMLDFCGPAFEPDVQFRKTECAALRQAPNRGSMYSDRSVSQGRRLPVDQGP